MCASKRMYITVWMCAMALAMAMAMPHTMSNDGALCALLYVTTQIL